MKCSNEVFQDLLTYIAHISKNAASMSVRENPTECEKTMGCLATLTEEVGELAAEVRQQYKLSFNKEKVANAKLEDVGLEAVDVLICTLILMENMGMTNLDELITKKIGKNNARGY